MSLEGPSLFDPPPFVAGSATSEAAAEAISPDAPTLRRLVLDALREAGERGMTDQEIQRRLDMDPSTERPRRGELVKAGLVVDSGRQRKTTSDRNAVVWIATEARHEAR